MKSTMIWKTLKLLRRKMMNSAVEETSMPFRTNTMGQLDNIPENKSTREDNILMFITKHIRLLKYRPATGMTEMLKSLISTEVESISTQNSGKAQSSHEMPQKNADRQLKVRDNIARGGACSIILQLDEIAPEQRRLMRTKEMLSSDTVLHPTFNQI